MNITKQERIAIIAACKILMRHLESVGKDASFMVMMDGVEVCSDGLIYAEIDTPPHDAVTALDKLIDENSETQKLFRKSCGKLIEELGVDTEAALKIFMAGLDGSREKKGTKK